jgi:Bacterial capsule synthesis protein PGA_cap
MLSLRAGFLAGLSLLISLAAGCTADPSVGDENDMEEEEEAGQTEDPLSAPAATGPLRFTDACRPGTKVTIAAVGDVLLHGPLQKQSYASPEGFSSLWKNVQPFFANADLSYANLEGPCADGHTTSGRAQDPGKVFDGRVYSSYPQFNYHPSLIPALKGAGVDVVSTANNHALDRRGRGADRTIENLNGHGLPYTGTRSSANPDAPWYAITEAKGVRIAWLACTFSTNGIPDPKNQVLSCYEDKTTLLSTIKSLSQSPEVDAVIVTPHWGVEYQHIPSAPEKKLAHDMLDAGATAVLGGHPHVVQPWEKYTTADGREGFVIYSLGNFVSGQSGLAKRSALVLYLGLTKGPDGKVTVNGVRHAPIQMNASPWTAAYAKGDSLALTTRLLGEWNRIGPDEDLVTNPECN